MKTYLVGGSVRDELLGLPVQDHDFVVVGATPAQMAELGFRPVGSDFPVFLHPGTQEEYALARTERKTAPGYKGFVFHADASVTLEEDLKRRDLTINAMARGDDGRLVDPHGGEKDLRAGVLRHVSDAFAEDPVRILRVARFAARFGFSIAPETLALMKRMVQSGEADALVPERVWQELARGLMEKNPSKMIAVLHECGALGRIFPEVDRSLAAGKLATRLDDAAARGYALPVRFALLVLDVDAEAIAALAQRVNAPNDCRDAARLSVQVRGTIRGKDAESVLSLLERCDAFRRPDRFEQLIEVAECDAPGVPRALLMAALEAARNVDAGAIARDNAADIPGALRKARLAAVRGQTPS
ncbi:MAG: multifunctional CCA tRNA nucleotidyl transferase/2'3'-cyclic phosphodiesterase/2'nucleotidase/phosphatase [Usitatibacter sp.]